MFYFGADEWYTSFKGKISDVRFFYDLSFLSDGILIDIYFRNFIKRK